MPTEKKPDFSEKKPEIRFEKAPEKSEADKCLDEIQKILAEHGGMEPNIPVNHDYWKLLSKYRSFNI